MNRDVCGICWALYDDEGLCECLPTQPEPVAKYDPIELHVLHSHIAGVLFDFMGWLTSRKKRLTLSSTDEASPAVEAITEFAKMRGLHLEDAQVEHWQAILIHPPRREWRGLDDSERAAVQFESFKRGLSPLEFMELHEKKLKEKNHDPA
jgi:hypothetical protein